MGDGTYVTDIAEIKSGKDGMYFNDRCCFRRSN